MRIYFLSSIPAALYVGGAYFGKVSDFERFAEISLQDGLPVRLEAEGMQPLQFFLDESLPLRPPKGVDVYRLENGLALYAHGFTATDVPFTVISQKRNGDALATVTAQGSITLGIESPIGFFNATLPPSFSCCDLLFHEQCVLVKSPTQVAVFSMLGTQLLMESYINFDILGQEIALTIPLSDRYQRTAECRYQLNNGELLRTSYTLKQGSEISQDSLIAYAFFESIRIGADASAFLCEELSNSIEQTINFLGEFLHVIPTESPTVCLLVYKKTERLYDVRKFTVTIENEKITDIIG